MYGAKRMRSEREFDLSEIASLYVRGYTHQAISDYIAQNRPYTLSLTQIGYDLKLIRNRWLESAVMNFNEAKSKELARLDELERTYWEAWERSLKDAELSTIETIEDKTGTKQVPTYSRKKGKRTIETKEGNVNFLLGIERCIDKRCKILGLFAPREIDINWRKEAAAAGADPDAVLNSLINQFVESASLNESVPQVMLNHRSNGNEEPEDNDYIQYGIEK